MDKIWQNTVFLAVVACLLWSTAFATIKLGLPYTTPIQFAGIRFFLAGLLLVPLALRMGGFGRSFGKNYKFIIVVALSQTFVQYALFYWGISMVPGGITAITIGAQPLFVAIVAHFAMANERMTVRKVLSISLGLSGIVLISLGKGVYGGGGPKMLFGISLIILSNLSSGIGNIVISKMQSKVSAVMLSSWQLMLGGLGLFVLSLFIEPFKGFVFPLPYYLSLGWLSFLSAAAFTIWFNLLQRPGVKVSDLNIWKFVIPVFGAIISWMAIPGESADLISVGGMLIIVIALLWYNFQVKGRGLLK
jgi:drug/metabolite transporter (DMT)-like permease